MQKKRKTNLFRFVTLRAPQLISADRRALGFIDHPAPSNSAFLSIITGIIDLNQKRSTLSNVATTFTPYSKVSDIKNISSDLWEFSLWLMKNKDNLVRSELDTLIPSPLPSSTEIIKLWDNVFYDILTKSNAPIRQSCLQMIVAINFINNYASYSPGVTTDTNEILAEAASIQRLANGKVIIDPAFTVEKSEILSAPIGIGNKSYTRNEAKHKAHLASLEIAPLEALRLEFCNLEKQYTSDRKTAYNTQYIAYKQHVKTTIDQYIKQNNIQGNDIESQLPYGLIDEFVLALDSPLSSSYTQGKLSTKALAYLSNHCFKEEDIPEVIRRIDNDLIKIKQKSTKLNGRKVNQVLIKGVTARSSSSIHHDYTFSIEELSGNQKNQINVYLTISTEHNGGYFSNPDFKIKINNTDYSHSDLDIISNDAKAIFAKISFGTLATITKNQEFIFTGNFDLSNGKTVTMTRTGMGAIKLFSGTLYTVRSINGQVEHYGVNRIGVADYRRVEQELCCYVAGEVSHIENILAKEYKEKATRQLTRSESSLELRTERETEELSDTTTTTRHEMSSEVSEIVNRDRQFNFGFSAGANGTYAKVNWNTNVNGNMAFGHSTSNSDSEARNYAEDVTNRALERIVQKSSIIRSSKVLREFEENNKHGFDNREGSNHVTGIYRWIDKVYKNRIVNYGKRLIYEFMVPEPAKFYKEAIIKEVEEVGSTGTTSGDSINAVPLPPNPADEGIESPKSINRENYLEKLAIYGAEARSPFPAEKSVTQSYAESIGTGDKEHTFNYAESALQVPDLYHCVEINGVLGGNYKAILGHSAYWKLSAGGNWQVTGLSGEGIIAGVDKTNIKISGLNVEGTINVKINTRKIVAFNTTLTAKCSLNDSEYNAWQMEVYQAIMKKYEQQLQAYKDAEIANKVEAELSEQQAKKEQTASNSGFNTQIIITELKRLCIEMLTQPFGIDQGKDFYKSGACDVPKLGLTEDLDRYASHVKFFEQAFDWELMASHFYPYYWAKKCDWKALFQSNDGNDHIFRAFLQSGMGRVIVPVREGFEDAVSYFMETGEIWNGIGLAISTDDELYLSIMDETTRIQGIVEGQEWETVVPTTLTIVQARSALLDEEGLPCCESDADVLAALNIKADTNTLTLKSETTT